MMADTIEELHEMAALIGLRESYFQNNNERFPHYDLTPNKRSIATKEGAIEMNSMELIRYFKSKLHGKKS